MNTVRALAALTAFLALAPGASAQTSSPAFGAGAAPALGVRVSPLTFRAIAPTALPPTPAPPAPRPAPAAPGVVECQVTENGVYGPAHLELFVGRTRVAAGSCATPLSIAAGTYDAVITLQSSADRPTLRRVVTVSASRTAVVPAAFSTAILEVRFTRDRLPVFGTMLIQKDGAVVATAGRLPVTVSAGRYELVLLQGGERRTLIVELAPGQRRAISASF